MIRLLSPCMASNIVVQVPISIFAANPLEGRVKKRRTGEAAFIEGFVYARNAHLRADALQRLPQLASRKRPFCSLDVTQVSGVMSEQFKYFKKLDNAMLEPTAHGDGIFCAPLAAKQTTAWERHFKKVCLEMETNVEFVASSIFHPFGHKPLRLQSCS